MEKGIVNLSGVSIKISTNEVSVNISITTMRELCDALKAILEQPAQSVSPAVPTLKTPKNIKNKDFVEQPDNTPITNSQWCDLLNAGTSEGMSIDSINAFILKTYGYKTRALPSGKYDEAVAAVKQEAAVRA